MHVCVHGGGSAYAHAAFDNDKQMRYLNSKIYWWPLLHVYVLQYHSS